MKTEKKSQTHEIQFPGGPGKYQADLTSYDYDAPMDEAGDPTPKYMLIRDAIKDFLPLPNISVPVRAPKLSLPPVQLTPKLTLLSPIVRRKLGRPPITSVNPSTFEQIDQYSGFVLYETVLPKLKFDPSILEVQKINDRAIVLIDDVGIRNTLHCNYINHISSFFFDWLFVHFQTVVGILSRENLAQTIALNGGYSGKTLQILVENQGRINFNIANDYKGILSDVKINTAKLRNWTITGFPLENVDKIEELVMENIANEINENSERSFALNSEILNNGPAIYHATFDIDVPELYDTYINPKGWGKVRLLQKKNRLCM